MLKIWGRTNSSNVQKVMWCVGELNLPHERIDAGLQFGKNKEGWYLKMNPNGLVPVIDEDGFILWESNSIVRYLAARHSMGQLYPSDLKARADAERWMDWQLTVLGPPLGQVLMNLVRTAPDKRNWDLIRAASQQSATAITILDRQLEGRDYVTGPRFTVADIALGGMAYRWFNFPDIKRPELPHLKAWYERLSQRPAYRAHVMLPIT